MGIDWFVVIENKGRPGEFAFPYLVNGQIISQLGRVVYDPIVYFNVRFRS